MLKQGNSRAITTNQSNVHDKLDDFVLKYRNNDHQKPFQSHTSEAFEQLSTWLSDWSGEIILDSCCGVGESTVALSQMYPDCRIIGVDKSAARLSKHDHYAVEKDNYRVVRADVNDLWRLIASANWKVKKHCLFYPNPYPKSTQLQKRWYASPAMPAFMSITQNIEVRSNWRIYIDEFQQALVHYDIKSSIHEVKQVTSAISPFERKYLASEQICWQLITHI